METKNSVYHLKVEAYSNRIGELGDLDDGYVERFFSGVFFSLDEARETGKARLHHIIQELYKRSGFDNKQEFLTDDMLHYDFEIFEHALDSFEQCKRPETYDYDLYPPTFIKYEYDFDGELINRNYVWKSESVEIYRQVRENDSLPEAGTKYQKGDFVQLRTLRRNRYDHIDFGNIFLVVGTPTRDEDGRLKDNTYSIETIGKKGEYLWDWDWHYPFSGIHEDELVKYEGEIDKNSPLLFLRGAFLGDFDDMFTDEHGDSAIIRELENYRILLSPCTSWREIPDLAILKGDS